MRPQEPPRISVAALQSLRFLQKLQSGVSGSVFLSEHIPTGSYVAVKQILVETPSTAARFVAESKYSAAFCKHKHVVDMYATFTHGNYAFIVMELMTNDLLDVLEQYKSENDVQLIFQQVCKAVAHLHNGKVAHLDIKPENILLDKHGVAKLCDFGSSHSFSESLDCQVGTELYRAPETKLCGDFDKASADIWSLGVLLFLLLSGEFPYPGNTEEELLDSAKNEQVCFYTLEKTNRSKHAKSLVHQMLQKDPSSRPTIFEVLRHPFCFFFK